MRTVSLCDDPWEGVRRARMKRRRNVGIIGIGQTYHKAHRRDVNEVEMVNEAVRACLEDAEMTPEEIDCFVHGNMELFEGNYQPDLWHVEGFGGVMRSGFRVTTGGTTGSTLACAADHLVASGLYEVVMAVGFEKQELGSTTTAITAMADPLWARNIQTGAISGTTGAVLIDQFGERADIAAAKLRVIAANNARLNPYAHLKLNLTIDDVRNSYVLAWPLRLYHMCPESNGACAVMFASEQFIKRKSLKHKPVFIRDSITVHREESFSLYPEGGAEFVDVSHAYASKTLLGRNGFKNPVKEIDVFEMYDPSSWWALDWMTPFLWLEPGENIDLVEQGATEITGEIPIGPSGGVVSTNPIGATALIRVAEAALQVRGTAGPHQVPKKVKWALASGFGGTFWTVLHLLTDEA